jgi:protein arginine kinase activator
MKCQICREREATIHYIEIVENQKTSQWICSECAEKEGVAVTEVTKLEHGSLDAVLGDMLSSAPGEKGKEKAAPQPVCEACGYEYRRLQQKGRLGCPACYSAFRQQLVPLLRRYHHDLQHLGKSPRSVGPRAAMRKNLTQLKRLLEQAIAQEAYEEAASIRDEIREVEKRIVALDEQSDDPEAGGRERTGRQR